MGCGALRTYRTNKTCVEQCAIGASLQEASPVAQLVRSATGSSGSLSARSSGHSNTSEQEDGVASLSPSPSVQSEITSITSRPSDVSASLSQALHHHQRRYKGSHNSFSNDDLRSDVPTIAESIADMQDFQDLPMNSHSHERFAARSAGSSHSLDLPIGSRNSGRAATTIDHERQRTPDDYIVHSLSMPVMTSPRENRVSGFLPPCGSHSLGPISDGPIIDGRQHPLAVSFCATQSNAGDAQSCFPNVSDIGACSDVPSIRDDASVTSAPSEICVSFPPSVYNSETGTLTPTRARMQSISNLRHEKLRRGSHPSLFGSVGSVPEKENPLLNLMCEAGEDTETREGPESENAETPSPSPRSLTPSSSSAPVTGAYRASGLLISPHRSDPLSPVDAAAEL